MKQLIFIFLLISSIASAQRDTIVNADLKDYLGLTVVRITGSDSLIQIETYSPTLKTYTISYDTLFGAISTVWRDSVSTLIQYEADKVKNEVEFYYNMYQKYNTMWVNFQRLIGILEDY